MAWEIGSPNTGEEVWSTSPLIIKIEDETLTFDEKKSATEVKNLIITKAREHGLARIVVSINGRTVSPAEFDSVYNATTPPLLIEVGKADYAGCVG